MSGRAPRPAAASVAALVGHELSTPIATALLYLGIAECHAAALKPNGLLRSALAVAKSEIAQLKRLLDRVTQLEQRGEAQVSPREIDLGVTVRAAVERTLLAGGRRDEVTVQYRGDLTGWWDDVAVQEIVANLLSNALKFGEQRGVRVTVEPATGGARIAVSDHGQGIRARVRGQIFGRGRRAPPHRGGGLGLGLWVVRELVRAHGGRVAVQSRVGHGSTISVHLPALAPRGNPSQAAHLLVPLSPAERRGPGPAATPSVTTAGPHRPRLVLLPGKTAVSAHGPKRQPRRRGDWANQV